VKHQLSMWLAVAAALLGSCGLMGDDSGSDTLDVSVWERPASYDPHRAQSRTEKLLAPLLFPGLVSFDGSGQVMPALAESWDISPDGLTYIFRLQDRKWSDGETLNAEDVVDSFRRLFDARVVPGASAHIFNAVSGAEAILQRKAGNRSLGVLALADNVVQFKLAHPDPAFLQRLALPQAAIVPVHVAEELGKAMFQPGQMVTAGSFRVDTEKKGVIDLSRPSDKPGIGKLAGSFNVIRLHVMKDAAATLAAFADKKIAIVDTTDVPTGLLEGQERQVRDQLRAEPSWNTVSLAANVKSGPMADGRVRLALAIATDQQLLVEAAFPEQRVQPLQSLLPPLLPSYGAPAQNDWANWSNEQRDVEVNRLLTEAGFSQKMPLKLRVLVTQNEADARIVQALKDQWSRFAVQVELRTVKTQSDVLRQAALGGIDLARISFEQNIDSPEDFLRVFGCKTRGRLSMMICNSEADQLIEDAVALNDTVQRIGLIKRAEQLLLADVPVLPLYVPARRTLVRKSILGWTDSVAGMHPLAALRPAQ
jgi:oligopeptide transport system substrate-binding protein